MGEGQYFYDLVRTQKICDTDFAVFADESGHREKRPTLNKVPGPGLSIRKHWIIIRI